MSTKAAASSTPTSRSHNRGDRGSPAAIGRDQRETITWSGTLSAVSSIAHAGETRGTITLLRREVVVDQAGQRVHVPIISGNTLRGRLRRIGEELLREAVVYEGELSPAAAHALRGGGSLAKSSREPLSGSRLSRIRELVPQIGVFGAAGGGTIIGGALDVGKVVPHLVETQRITGVQTSCSAFTATQLEPYTRQDDAEAHDFVDVLPVPARPAAAAGSEHSGRAHLSAERRGNQMLFHIETFPAGTQFSTWLRLRRPSGLELSFFVEVLKVFAGEGRLGGRVAIGHGIVRSELTPEPELPDLLPDWRDVVRRHRSEILTVLQELA